MADGLLNKASIILTPTGYKAGTLYNVAPVAEPYEDFDFARASVASRVNSSGLVEMVGRTLGSELITNGDFATDSDWNLSSESNIINGELVIDALDGSYQYAQQNFNTIEGQTYIVQFNITEINDVGKIQLLYGVDVIGLSEYTSVGTHTLYFTSDSSSGTFNIKRKFPSNTKATIDNVSVKEIIDTNNIPRISYDSNGENGHILLEPTTTNLYLNTDTLSTQNVSTSASDYSVSFYGTGTITFSGSYSGSLVGTGVNDRVSLTFTATSGTLTSTVSGSVTNAQIENLGYSTSYMPSLSTQGVRATETANGAGSAELINSTEGVLYAEIAALADDATNRCIALSDGTSDDRVTMLFGTSSNRIRAIVKSNGSTSFDKEYTVTSTLDYHKVAIKYKANDFALWIDGVERFTDTSGSAPIGLNQLKFDVGSGALLFYGKCKALAVFNEALSDSELTQLTT